MAVTLVSVPTTPRVRHATTVTAVCTADALFEVSGAGYEPVGDFTCGGTSIAPTAHSDLMFALEVGVLASRGDAVCTNTGWAPRGDPTAVALAVAAMKAGLSRRALTRDRYEIGDLPCARDGRVMAVFHRSVGTGRTTAFVNGTPHHVLERCWSVFTRGASRPLTPEIAGRFECAHQEMATRGLRVLALATGDIAHPDERSLHGLTFIALIGISDPPAPAVTTPASMQEERWTAARQTSTV